MRLSFEDHRGPNTQARPLLLRVAAALALTCSVLVPGTASASPPRTAVSVLVPEAGNLQLLPFYVALGAGYFAREGLDVSLVSPPAPALAQGYFTNGAAPVALLPAPVYERLIEERFPFLLVANLLANDPIDLVVSREVAASRGLLRPLPLGDRLRALRGLRLGVAPHPRPRLDALFASQGLEVESLLEVVIVPGRAQDEALASGDVDALYTHTPFLENAVVDQGAVVLVGQSRGDVPALAGRQIHALAVTRAFDRSDPAAVRSLVAAIARAEVLVHSTPRDATESVLRAQPTRDRAHVEQIVALYAPAVPATPRVSARAIAKELAFYPDAASVPQLGGIDLTQFVRADRVPPRGERLRPRLVLLFFLLVGAAASAAAIAGDRKQ